MNAKALPADGMEATPVEINWHPDLSIYASEPFLKAVGDEYGWLGGYDKAGTLCCILPYTIIRKAFIRMVRFRVETISLGEELTIEQEKSFLNSVIDYFRSTGADMIIPATTNTIFRTYPDGAIAAPYGSYIVDLTQSEDALWNRLHSKHRNVIRNGIKRGVVIAEGIEHADVAYKLIKETLMRSSLRFMGYREYEKFVTSLKDHIKIFVAYSESIAQGSAVIPYSNHSAYYLYGGTILKPLSGAMNLLQWESMRIFRELGVQRYDFVGARINPTKGSKQEGLMMFKQRFGGHLSLGYMWKYPLNALTFAVYSLAVRVLRGGDIVDHEAHKLDRLNSSSV